MDDPIPPDRRATFYPRTLLIAVGAVAAVVGLAIVAPTLVAVVAVVVATVIVGWLAPFLPAIFARRR